MDGDARFDQVQQDPTCRMIGRQSLERFERQWMVRDDQVGSLPNLFAGDGGRNRQARDYSLDCLSRIANEQTNIIPLGRQGRWSKGLEKRRDVSNGRHGTEVLMTPWEFCILHCESCPYPPLSLALRRFGSLLRQCIAGQLEWRQIVQLDPACIRLDDLSTWHVIAESLARDHAIQLARWAAAPEAEIARSTLDGQYFLVAGIA